MQGLGFLKDDLEKISKLFPKLKQHEGIEHKSSLIFEQEKFLRDDIAECKEVGRKTAKKFNDFLETCRTVQNAEFLYDIRKGHRSNFIESVETFEKATNSIKIKDVRENRIITCGLLAMTEPSPGRWFYSSYPEPGLYVASAAGKAQPGGHNTGLSKKDHARKTELPEIVGPLFTPIKGKTK